MFFMSFKLVLRNQHRFLVDTLLGIKEGVIILRGSIFFVRVCANYTYSMVEK